MAAGTAAAVEAAPPPRRRKRKDKGFLAPGLHAQLESIMSEPERRVGEMLRMAMGVEAGQCPSLEECRERLDELLHAMHGEECRPID